MATRYADFIKMQDFLPVYDMTDETPNLWQTFIPTNQFCDLLTRSITAITSSDISKRRSMWVRGAFWNCIYNHRTTKTNQKYPSVNL